MLQWITALDKVSTASPYTKKNRFDSFAPARLNVAAQWLVDGVSILFVSSDLTNFIHDK
jgi:phospholipase D1/2